jgi:hypothetical protein
MKNYQRQDSEPSPIESPGPPIPLKGGVTGSRVEKFTSPEYVSMRGGPQGCCAADVKIFKDRTI